MQGKNKLCRGFGTVRFLNSMLEGLVYGNGDIEIETRIRNDSAIAVEHVHWIDSAAKGRRLGGFLESNIEESGGHPWLALSRIMGMLNISGEIEKAKTPNKLILFSRNIRQRAGGNVKDAIKKHIRRVNIIYRFHKLEKVGRIWTHTCGEWMAYSWKMVKITALLLIKTCIMEDQKLKIERNSEILIFTFKISLGDFANFE